LLSFKKVLEPQYLQSFRCSAADCQDSCCIGWDVVIDQATYDAYEKCQDVLLKPLFHEHIAINDKSVGNSTYIPYALVKMNHHSCPFLTDERLCIIQKTLNEDALSITCATYPHTFNDVDGVLERSLCVSCPEAARLVLLNKNPMQFDSSEIITNIRNLQIPILNTQHDAHNKPYRYFWKIRAFIITLLQDRTYPLWQRLIILSTFCNKLDQVTAKYYEEDIPYLISYFTDKIREGEYREPMNNAATNLEIQLQAMKILIDHRLQGEFVTTQFLDFTSEFTKGICFIEGASLEVAVERYAEVYNAHYQPFMKNHEYILENYLVNYVFKNLFPFGPQKSIFYEQRSIYTEYTLLVLHYSMIKTLLIGMAGYHRKDFSTKHVVKLIQTFAKTIEHNLPYLKQAVQFINASNMNNTGGMTVLMKN
jgi:lysine-N-methylase